MHSWALRGEETEDFTENSPEDNVGTEDEEWVEEEWGEEEPEPEES